MRALRKKVRETLLSRWMPAERFARQLGPLDGCFNEWSVISDASGAGQAASRELLDIALAAIARAMQIDEGFLNARTNNPDVRIWPGEHYRLLPALCEATGARRVMEIGTLHGESALAFLASPTVDRVDTFDLVAWNETDGTVLKDDDFADRLTQHIADLSDPRVFDRYADLLADADLIFVDGPKDGVFEASFLTRLLSREALCRQLIVLDDIRVMTMVQLWRELPPPKLDLTSFGHWSGTGALLRQVAATSGPGSAGLTRGRRAVGGTAEPEPSSPPS
jgi:predicted O-methyltransferase YrrM